MTAICVRVCSSFTRSSGQRTKKSKVPGRLLNSASIKGCTKATAARTTIAICLVVLVCLLGPWPYVDLRSVAAENADDRIILDSRRYDIVSGRYSVFADFQSGLQEILSGCGKPDPALVPSDGIPSGRIGALTRQAIQRVLSCQAVVGIAQGSLAHKGVITEKLWHAVMGGAAPPSVADRANALVLSFEATDFGDAPEWNLCQDGRKPNTGSSSDFRADMLCYNESDPCSFVTWGPRGATAGMGREIQHVLWIVWKNDPRLLKRAFGAEFESLLRFFHLKNGNKDRCDGPAPIKLFVCAVWMDEQRRHAWEMALTQLGQNPTVRKAYASLYELAELDGAKLVDFYELWGKLGLPPSEVDYAFFIDRITHLGGPPDASDETVNSLKKCIHSQNGMVSVHGAARRCLSRSQVHETQPEYRLARDVAYFIDAYRDGALQESEIDAWARYVPLSAVNDFGLRDEKP